MVSRKSATQLLILSPEASRLTGNKFARTRLVVHRFKPEGLGVIERCHQKARHRRHPVRRIKERYDANEDCQSRNEVDNFGNLDQGAFMASATFPASLAWDVDPKKLLPQERKILDALKKSLAQQGDQTSALALARLTAMAFEMVVGAARHASPQDRWLAPWREAWQSVNN